MLRPPGPAGQPRFAAAPGRAEAFVGQAPRHPDDTRLVRSAGVGDRAAFAAVYDRYADPLHDYCWSLLHDADAAADATQDTFVLAAERLRQLRDPARLRSWLYAIARSQATLRLRNRDHLDLETGMAGQGRGPREAAGETDLRLLVWNAAAGLPERDRSILDLHLRHGLEDTDLGEAMGVSANHAHVLLTRARRQAERTLGALLVAKLGRDDCPELNQLLASWDGRFAPVIRKRVARHVDRCAVCDRRRAAVSPVALLAGVPPLVAPLDLRDRVLAGVRLPGEPPAATGGGPATGGARAPTPPPGSVRSVGRARRSRKRQRRHLVTTAALVAVVSALIGAGISYSSQNDLSRPRTSQVAAPVIGFPTTTLGSTSSVSTSSSIAVTTTQPTAVAIGPTDGSTPSTVVPSPPELAVAPARLTLTVEDASAALTVRNTGGGDLAWSASASLPVVGLKPANGVLGRGRSTKVAVAVPQRVFSTRIPIEAAVTVSSNGGDAVVAVVIVPGQTTTTSTTTTSPTTTTLVAPGAGASASG